MVYGPYLFLFLRRLHSTVCGELYEWNLIFFLL